MIRICEDNEIPDKEKLFYSFLVFAQAIETMSREPPSSLASNRFESPPPPSFANIPLQSLSQQFPPQPLSMLQQAIQQSEQQFNSNPAAYSTSNGFNSVAPFQPFDLFPNTFPGIPVGPLPTSVPPQQQQSPIQPNNIRLGSPQTMSSPMNISHNSPPSQVQPAQPNNSPRMSGGSTLQFVPSQVLRKMPKSHK